MTGRRISRTGQGIVLLAALAPLVLACTADPDGGVAGSVPSGPIAAVCDKTQPGPTSPPEDAVTVDPSISGELNAKTVANPPGTTFWLAPGTHTFGTGEYDQVIPKNGNVYLGAPGAILDGGGTNRFAFTQRASDVVIRHLTIQNFDAPHNQGVVNHDSGDGWVIEHNTIQNNAGAALMAGARQQVRANCLRNNGQYGMNAYQQGDRITGLVVEGNEIVGNNTADWEQRLPGCGCTGGIKFWAVDGADIRDNWIHHNHGPGLWADTNNNDFLIERNLIEDNEGSAIFYEISYNAVIRNNRIHRNNWTDGRMFADRGDSFPVATIYISESGGEPRVKARTDKIEIYDNVLEDNWSGITLWENADRFCNNNASEPGGTCTRLVKDTASCSQPNIADNPLYSDCRWKTQRVDIHHNRFSLNPTAVGCRSLCGRMAVLSNYGTDPDWTPYQGNRIQEAITFKQDNRWHDNTYLGPWAFTTYDANTYLYSAQWQSAPYRQDQGSTFTPNGGR